MNRHSRRKADALRRRRPRVPGQHNYLRPFLQAAEEARKGGKIEQGRVTLCNVWHYEWCEIYRGGLCNCDPQIEFQPLAKPGEIN